VHKVYTVIQTGVKQFGYYKAKSTKMKQNYTKLAATLRWFTAGGAIRYRCTTTFANLEITSL